MGFKFLRFICSFLLLVCCVNLPVELALVETGVAEVIGGTAGFSGQQGHCLFLSSTYPRPCPGPSLGYRVQQSGAHGLTENKNIWHVVKIHGDLQQGDSNSGQFKDKISSRTFQSPGVK